MKKIFISVCIIFLFFSLFFNFCQQNLIKNKENETIPDYIFSNSYKTFNFKSENNKKATEDFKIFLIYEDKFQFKENDEVYAFLFDLDNDDEKEIIGAYKPYLNGSDNSYIFRVLKKQNGKYNNIFSFVFSIEKPISILKSKTNKFYDIGFIGPSFWRYKPFVVKFNGEEYKIDEEDKILYMGNNHDFKISNKLKFDKNVNAQEAIFSYILDNYKGDIENFFEIFKKEDITTAFYDLDDNGKEEIIGTTSKMYFCGEKDVDIFILKEVNGKYKSLTGTVPLCVSSSYPMEILKEKANGYHKLLYYSLGEGLPRSTAPYIPFVLEYQEGLYQNEYAI